MKRLPSCSISVSVSESRSTMISGQEPDRPNAADSSVVTVLMMTIHWGGRFNDYHLVSTIDAPRK
jgi:hypothetical protein